MNDLKSLDHLGPIAEEMLGGLHADEAMRLRIRRAAAQGTAPRRMAAARFAPAVCCAALALACVGAVSVRMNRADGTAQKLLAANEPAAVSIDTIAAGQLAAFDAGTMVADLGDGARVRAISVAPEYESLFAAGEKDIPLIAIGGGVYRMLNAEVDTAQLGVAVGSVRTHSEEPSLASAQEMEAGLSNVAGEGAAIYQIGALPSSTAVAAEVDGRMRIFQRVSYAGKGPGGLGLEDTFSVRGQVAEATLSGVGTLSGEKANEVIGVLLDQATLRTADATARAQALTVRLTNGVQLQLGVSGDTLCGCGGWSCPEFFEAFEAALQ